VFLFLVTLSVYAKGSNDPSVTVTTSAQDARTINFDWSHVQSPYQNKYGLYRATISDNAFSLIQELSPGTLSVTDKKLKPPLNNYFYFVAHVSLNEPLFPIKERKITEEEIAYQIASANLGIALIEEGSRQNNDAQAQSDSSIYNNTETPVAYDRPVKPSGVNDGIYFGLVVFSNKIEASPSLIPLDPTGRQELLERLNVSYTPSHANGTALYYAEHTALSNLVELDKRGMLPSNVESVNIITFTDGLDTSSTDTSFKSPAPDVNFAGKQSAAYRNYISQQIKTKRIAGKKIDAWGIGIPGRDVANSSDFSQTLEAVSSSVDHIAYLKNLTEIEDRLLDIADSLNIFTPVVKLTFSTPAYPVGTVVRITFDDAIYADGSAEYVEGRVSYENNSYSLNNLNSEGVKLASKASVKGRRTDNGIEYTVVLNNELPEIGLMQWHKQNAYSGSDWQTNSEFDMSKITDFTSSRKSAIIYLVLDCSSSLTATEINEIREAVSVFIDRLYNSASTSLNLSTFARNNSSPETRVSIRASQLPPDVPHIQMSQQNTLTVQPSSLQSDIPQFVSPQSIVQADQAVVVQQPPIYQAVQPQYQPPAYQQSPAYQQPPVYQQPPAYQQPPVQQQYSQQQYDLSQSSYSQPPRYQSPQYVLPPTSPPSVTTGERTFIPSVTQSTPAPSTPEKTVTWNESYSGFWVQVGAYSELRFAQNMWRTLYTKGCTYAEIFGKEIEGVMYYRVKVGPYQNRHDAEAALGVLRETGSSDCFIVKQ
jgi:cell division protein FtsN